MHVLWSILRFLNYGAEHNRSMFVTHFFAVLLLGLKCCKRIENRDSREYSDIVGEKNAPSLLWLDLAYFFNQWRNFWHLQPKAFDDSIVFIELKFVSLIPCQPNWRREISLMQTRRYSLTSESPPAEFPAPCRDSTWGLRENWPEVLSSHWIRSWWGWQSLLQ